jgi:hypothetical protein
MTMELPMSSSASDRRTRRSQSHTTALRFQLESTMQKGRMDALALVDQRGLLVAWAGKDDVCEELGALAPAVAQRTSKQTEPTKDDMAVRAIDWFGEPMYLAALGGGVARDALLSHSAKGIHRILTAN